MHVRGDGGHSTGSHARSANQRAAKRICKCANQSDGGWMRYTCKKSTKTCRCAYIAAIMPRNRTNVQWRELINRLIEFRLEDHNDLEFKYAETSVAQKVRANRKQRVRCQRCGGGKHVSTDACVVRLHCRWSRIPKRRATGCCRQGKATITYRFCNVRVRTYLYNFVRFEQQRTLFSPRSLNVRPV